MYGFNFFPKVSGYQSINGLVKFTKTINCDYKVQL